MDTLGSSLSWLVAALFVWVCALTLYVQHLHIRIMREHNHFTQELSEIYTRMNALLQLVGGHSKADAMIAELKRRVEQGP